ncbi:MAG: hypothetical protein K2X77_13930 [Candidatus Obscuribacterales bacterium]|jgi:hypothetical protein|nr:hypothetical protein [Candidatus Obscuribacterales bacterium]
MRESRIKQRRNEHGAIFFIVVASILIVLIVGAVLGWLLILTGGFRESQHAVDSGSLNLAKQVVRDPAVELQDSTAERFFFQMAEQRNGKYYANLNNINRLSAELLLIDTNCAAMREENSSDQRVATVSEPMHHALDNIQGKLAEQLAARANVISHYEGTANENSIRMLRSASNNDIRIYQTDYRTAFTDRGNLSNVYLSDKQIPKAFRPRWETARSSWARDIPDSMFGDKRHYLLGYVNDINPLGSKPLYFVSLKEGGNLGEIMRCQPHLISESTMKQDMDTGRLAWKKPIPNAFGITMNTGTKYVDPLSTTASSSVARSLRPTEGFSAQIAHGFIRIRNAPPQNISCSVDDPHKDDVFNFIKKKPKVFAEGPPKRHFEEESDPYIDNILKALKNKQPPKESDLNALKKPADKQEAKEFQKKSDKVDNHTYKSFPPLVPVEIGEAYSKHVPREGAKQSEQLHCYEAACYALLAARSIGDTGDPFSLKAGQSGIAEVREQRNPLAARQKQFTKAMTLAEIFKASDSSVMDRLKERCFQMFPAFNGELKDIPGWSSERIPMGATLYIYWDGTIDQESGRPLGTLRVTNENDIATRAPWVVSNHEAMPEGRVAAIDCNVIPISPKGAGGLDLPGDWSYDEPFDTYNGDKKLVVRNLVSFSPASGVHGLLGEIDMVAQFGATTDDHLGVQVGFSTHDITQKGGLTPKSLKVNGKYSGPG